MLYKQDTTFPLVLASSSPRRRELLNTAGVSFITVTSAVDETALPAETPSSMVERLSLLKAKAVAPQYPESWVIGADTTVAVGGQVLGKPEDTTDALRMISLLQGTTHEVWSAFSLVHTKKSIEETFCASSRVTMGPISPEERARYIATGEPMDKAGGYAMQGIGAHFVTKLEGSYTNVVGLDTAAVIARLKFHKVIW